MRRKLTLPRLANKFWRIFSTFVRRKDADENGYVRCFTCGVARHFKEMDAGHYIASSTSLFLRYDERNVKPQCTRCNMFLSSNGTQYALGLEKLYGPGILQQLEQERHTPTKYSRDDYEQMILKYEEKLKNLDGEILGAH